MNRNIIYTSTAIHYIERNLQNRLDIKTIANAVHHSKYHLHRIFTDTAGLPIHGYIQRRRLTEAARQLVFSGKSIIEIALTAGYESQQAFTDVFRLLYKKPPHEYRKAQIFYPLLLRYSLNLNASKTRSKTDWQNNISFATETDIPAWMDLLHLVVDGFPCLNEGAYREQLKSYIQKKQAMVLKDANILIGAMIFDDKTRNIDFFGIHPQYPKDSIAKAFIQKLCRKSLQDNSISITTFREGDKADLGYRALYKKFGFTENDLLVEFNYPTQKLILKKENLKVYYYE